MSKLRILARHMPTLIIFFVMGLASLDSVTSLYFVRDHVRLSAETLIELGIWTSLPWSIKIFFGAVTDSFRLLGNNRRSYIYLGALLMLLGDGLFALFAAGRLTPYLSEYSSILISGLVSTVGLIFAQNVANTLAVEMVAEGPGRTRELGYLQVATRFALSVGAILAAAVTGYLHAHYTAVQVFSLKLALPVIVILVTYISNLVTGPTTAPVSQRNWRLLGLSIAFALFVVLTRSQTATFLAQMVVINYLLYRIARELEPRSRSTFLLSCAAIFLFRVSPGIGPGVSWWMTTVGHGGLAFDDIFMGHLRLISTAVDIVAIAALASTMAKGDIYRSLLWLTVAGTLLSLPVIAIFYHMEHLVHLTARQVMVFDTAANAPLGDLSMIPLGILIAIYAPNENRALYMSITASFMNMALLGSDLIAKYLNHIYTITRTDFSQLGELMLVGTTVGTALSVIGLILLRATTRERT